MFRYNSLQRTPSSSSTTTISKSPRCNANYSLLQSSSSSWGITSAPLAEKDLDQFKELNMDLKEFNNLFTDMKKKASQKNSNLKKINKNKKSTQSNRNSVNRQYNEEIAKFNKIFKKILSEKIKVKTLQRLDRLISNPEDGRLNKVACVIKALLEVLKSCNISISNEELIRRYKAKITAEYPAGVNGAEEFIKDILEKNDTSLKDFINKQSTHNKQLGEKLVATIKELQTCSA